MRQHPPLEAKGVALIIKYRRKGGSDPAALEALGHENAATTRVYVQRITVKRDRHGAKVAGRMRLRRDGAD